MFTGLDLCKIYDVSVRGIALSKTMTCFAAELVMHSERVTRHTKGIIQVLAELRQGFNKMTQEHNKLASKFREDIEALEVVFVNATKSSK